MLCIKNNNNKNKNYFDCLPYDCLLNLYKYLNLIDKLKLQKVTKYHSFEQKDLIKKQYKEVITMSFINDLVLLKNIRGQNVSKFLANNNRSTFFLDLKLSMNHMKNQIQRVGIYLNNINLDYNLILNNLFKYFKNLESFVILIGINYNMSDYKLQKFMINLISFLNNNKSLNTLLFVNFKFNNYFFQKHKVTKNLKDFVLLNSNFQKCNNRLLENYTKKLRENDVEYFIINRQFQFVQDILNHFG